MLPTILGAGALHAFADDSPASSVVTTKSLTGARVLVELQSGKNLKSVTIEDVRPGKIPGTFSNLRVADPESGVHTMLGAAAIRRVLGVDGKVYLIFDATSKALAPPNAERLAAIHEVVAAIQKKAAAEAAAAPKPGHSAGDRTTKAKHAADAAADDDARRKANEAKRVAYFKKTGVWLWSEVTAKDQEEGLAAQKDLLRKVDQRFASLHMQLYETQYFLFFTDLPPQWVKVYTACLDAMYSQLCTAYAVKDKDRVWLGKLPVIAFSDSAAFEKCEKAFFDHPVDGKVVQGLAHMAASGEVAVTCHCGKDPYYFAGVLVHETTHGFNHRHLSAVQLPSWLDEGIADWTAMNVVHKNTAILRKVQVGLMQAKQQGNLGGNFFTDDKKIEPWQYGVAASIVNFMLKSSGKNFRKMFDAIKMGTKWQDALKDAYGVTPAELTAAFGRSVGIPNLQP
jgi:hypothetical protein